MHSNAYNSAVCIMLLWWFGVVGNDVGGVNEVAVRRARLVLGWVTVSGFNSRSVTRMIAEVEINIQDHVTAGVMSVKTMRHHDEFLPDVDVLLETNQLPGPGTPPQRQHCVYLSTSCLNTHLGSTTDEVCL